MIFSSEFLFALILCFHVIFYFRIDWRPTTTTTVIINESKIKHSGKIIIPYIIKFTHIYIYIYAQHTHIKTLAKRNFFEKLATSTNLEYNWKNKCGKMKTKYWNLLSLMLTKTSMKMKMKTKTRRETKIKTNCEKRWWLISHSSHIYVICVAVIICSLCIAVIFRRRPKRRIFLHGINLQQKVDRLDSSFSNFKRTFLKKCFSLKIRAQLLLTINQ